MVDQAQREQMRTGKGFIAALDQSGGSTPKALAAYGVGADRYATEDEMFDLVHAMRERIVTAPSFGGGKVIGAILFEQTMDRTFEGRPAAEYLWQVKSVVPFLKVDKGLEDAADGVQMMKDMGDLEGVLDRAVAKGIFGTKMRSVIGAANAAGIDRNVDQQFELGERIRAKGLVPILEPEVTITIPDKAEAEAMLREAIERNLDALPEDAEIMLKLSLPTEDGFYAPLIAHPKVLRVVALSGGHARDEANALLARNPGMIASFSRGLSEGLRDDMDDAEFEAHLGRAVDGIAAASAT
ncbi:MAG: fructose bisphosphate aldolase [Hasllibacter sp.]